MACYQGSVDWIPCIQQGGPCQKVDLNFYVSSPYNIKNIFNFKDTKNAINIIFMEIQFWIDFTQAFFCETDGSRAIVENP